MKAFDMALPEKGKPSYGVSNDAKGNMVLLALDEVKAGQMPEEQKKVMVSRMTENNAELAFEALMGNLRKEAKIKLGDAVDQQQ